ncbi:NAD(P)/FAD-dependent oxidoreductase [Chlorogloeopsis sp. ULAP02]|uniref:NAD(P)/FAD-dependent oxidoreductase n=1 Tax=Chlorogloeopsis sp. ULAP02 TaxID=3107926 RepID=UPI00313504B2
MNQLTLPTVILGGGFTGLFTALHLCHQRYPHPVILIDQKERFVFKPLLYELLSGEMTINQVCPRYDQLLNCSSVTFIQDTVQAIDLHQRQVELDSGLRYTYSNLVLALGSDISYFEIEGAKDNSLPLRNSEDVMALEKHLRNCLQRASQTEDLQQRRALLTVAVIGAGPAGIEMAATLADLLPHWYIKLGGDSQDIRIVILNRSQEILKGDVNGRLRETARKALQDRTIPVELELGVLVGTIHPNQVEYKRQDDVKTLKAATIIWTAGNRIHPLIKSLPISEENRDRAGRVWVTSTLQLPEFPTVFAGGDCAALGADPLPATAQVAYQQGSAIAHNLKALTEGNNPKPAKVFLRGTLLKLGLGESAANLFDRIEIAGRLGHIIRQGTYLELLPTPVHNFKATTEWLTDQLFDRYSHSMSQQRRSPQALRLIGGVAASFILASSGLLVWRATQPTHFNQTWQSTGLPTLLDRLLPSLKQPPN